MTARKAPEAPEATIERLMRFVDERDGCWVWTGARRMGYGRFNHRRVNASAHRVAYELFIGPIPDGMHIDHLCRNRACVRPAHLEPVTQAENNRRAGAVRTHCKNGHEYTPETIYWFRGYRQCIPCKRHNRRERRRRARAEA